MVAILRGIKIAILAIFRSPFRSLLTVLGILIGVSAVIIVASLAQGARASISREIQSIGSNLIFVGPQASNASGARTATSSLFRLKEEDARALLREAVSIHTVAPVLRTRAQVVRGDHNWATEAVGSTLPFFEIGNWRLAAGTYWTPSDEAVKAKVCVIGKTVREKLFGEEDPVGRDIRIGRYVYRIVGLLASKGQAQIGRDQDDTVVVPIGAMRSRILRTMPGAVGVIMLSATSPDTIDRAVKQIDSILRQRHRIPEGAEPDFFIRTQKNLQEMQGRIFGTLTLFMVAVAAISLVVGGIGIMNIMLVSVTERTREIGIRMAIGARENDIRTQFLVEAVVLSVAGGILGLLIGVGAVFALQKPTGWSMTVSPIAALISLGVSGATGVAFGFFPARRASTLDPIEALRRE
jgi:putative ABC transport system permease protein